MVIIAKTPETVFLICFILLTISGNKTKDASSELNHCSSKAQGNP